MISEALDFKYLLLENYKAMNISEKELVTILMIDHLLGQGNYFITGDLLSLKMNLPAKEIDAILASFLNRGFIEYYTKGKKTKTTLNPLRIKLIKEFELSMKKEEAQKFQEETTASIERLFNKFSETYGRTLSPVEQSRIKEWVSYGYKEDVILSALKETYKKNKKSIRSVDKLLLSWAAKDDIQSEGLSPIDDKWHKNLEETIRIAKTPWFKKDDEDK